MTYRLENLISKLNFYKLISYLVDRCICPAHRLWPGPVVSCLLARWLYSLPAGALRVRAHAYFLLLFAPCLSPLGMFVAGKAGWESLCPLGKILTYKNLIYLLNFPFYCVNISYLVDRCRITTHWMEGS